MDHLFVACRELRELQGIPQCLVHMEMLKGLKLLAVLSENNARFLSHLLVPHSWI